MDTLMHKSDKKIPLLTLGKIRIHMTPPTVMVSMSRIRFSAEGVSVFVDDCRNKIICATILYFLLSHMLVSLYQLDFCRQSQCICKCSDSRNSSNAYFSILHMILLRKEYK